MSDAAYGLDRLLHDAVTQAGGRPAVATDGEFLSYAELAERARRVAGQLSARMADNRRVALLADNDTHYVCLYWGVLLSGGVTVELNPELGEHELARQIRNAEPWMLVSVGRHAGRLQRGERAGGGVPIGVELYAQPGPGEQALARKLAAILAGEDPPQADPAPVSAPSACFSAERLASIVYTSGTTGAVKGVCLSHGNLAWTARAIAQSFGLTHGGAQERFAGTLPLYYTYGKSVLHVATYLRSPVLFSTRALSPNAICTLVEEGEITHLSLVPFHCSLLVSSARFCARALPSIRRVTVAGGALPDALRRELLERFPGRVVPMYGLTEASTRLTCMAPGETSQRPDSCGTPLTGVDLRVVAEDGRPLGVGEVGEVQARGPNVMQGYFRDEAASCLAMHGDWLSTGDIGFVDGDGYLYIRGRRKDIIKVMGESVSAPGIESAIAELAQVSEVAVTGTPHPDMGEAICAFVVLCNGERLSEDEVRRHCARTLGRARVPTHVRFVDALPKTASGKVRKHLLAVK